MKYRVLFNGKYLYQDNSLLRIRNNYYLTDTATIKTEFLYCEIKQIIAALNRVHNNYEINLEKVGETWE